MIFHAFSSTFIFRLIEYSAGAFSGTMALGLQLLLFNTVCLIGIQSAIASQRPHIVFIMADDLVSSLTNFQTWMDKTFRFLLALSEQESDS